MYTYIWLSVLEYNVPVLIQQNHELLMRQLLHEPRWCSASRLFVFHNVSSFTGIIRKLGYPLLCSLRDCNNLLVCAMLHGDMTCSCNHFCLRDDASYCMHFSSLVSFFLLIVFNYCIFCAWATSLSLNYVVQVLLPVACVSDDA